LLVGCHDMPRMIDRRQYSVYKEGGEEMKDRKIISRVASF